MKEILKQWINEQDLPPLLRAISELCRERYEMGRDAYVQCFLDSDQGISEETPEERKAHDISGAFLGVDLRYVAEDFENRLREAGLSTSELAELRRQREIIELQGKISLLQSVKPSCFT